MKKVMAILLAALMTLSLFACGGGSASGAAPEASTSQAPSSPPAAESATPTSSGTAVEAGFFDPNKDYSKNPTYTVVYMMNTTGVLYDSFSKSFGEWAKKENCNYSDWAANGDNDLYCTTLETYAAQGVQGFLLDPDITIYPRLDEILTELGVCWMPVMGPPRDTAGKLLHPSVGFNFYEYGKDMANWLLDYQKKNWPDAKPEEIGMLALDYSIAQPLHDRVVGEQEVWEATYPTAKANFYVGDGSQSGQLNSDTGYNISAPIISAHPEIKYWLVAGLLDDYADGAARALESSGKSATAVATVMGGSGLINHWDAGEDSCWKSALYTSETIYAEPIFNGLYAMMNGDATAETLWPDWVNKGEGEKYASLLIPSFFITKDNYQEYMEWCDAYTGINRSNYSYNGTEFSARAEVPASYAG